MKATWDFGALLKDVGTLYGERQAKLIEPCLQSIAKRQRYAAYHYMETRRLLGPPLEGRDSAAVPAEPILSTDIDAQGGHAHYGQAEAHYVALLHCMHAVADSLAYTLYFALGLNREFDKLLPERSIAIGSVRDRLEPGDIKEAARTMMIDADLKYVAALVSHSKDRSIIETYLAVSTPSAVGEPRGLKLAAFEHDGERYPARWVEPFVTGAFSRQTVHVFQIGNLLNAEVSRRVAELPAPVTVQ